jgi:hypothetical protein
MFRKGAIVEGQDEMTGLVADRLNRMAMTISI